MPVAGSSVERCAGQDIRLYFRATHDNPEERTRSNAANHRWRCEKLKTFPKPAIAMVNGCCYGAAFTQLCAVDFVITAEDALYGLSEVNWGGTARGRMDALGIKPPGRHSRGIR